MARAKITKRKRRIRIEGLVGFLLFIGVIFFLGSQFGLQAYNITLQKQAQTTEKEVGVLKDSISNLESEVNILQSRDRVLSYAEKEGIKTNQDNVVVVDGKDKE